jgi:hypothetical protein
MMHLTTSFILLSALASVLAAPGCGTEGLTPAELDEINHVKRMGLSKHQLAHRKEPLLPRQELTEISTYIHVFSIEERYHPSQAQIDEQVIYYN